MSNTFDSPLDGDVEIVLENDVSIDALIAALEKDPRFESMLIRVQSRAARRTGNLFGKWAQRPLPQTVSQQNPGTKRIS